MTDTPAAGQVDVVAFRAGADPIYLRQPTPGQLLFIYLLAGVEADTPIKDAVEAMNAFIRVIRYLVVSPSEVEDEDAIGWGELRNGVLEGRRDLEEIVGLAQGVVEKWGDEEEVERNRAERRAAARKPAAKAVARPGRAARR